MATIDSPLSGPTETNTTQQNGEGSSLRFSDWFPGAFLHPVRLFTGIRKRGPRHGDWLIPLAILFLLLTVVIFSIVSSVRLFGNLDEVIQDTSTILLPNTNFSPVDVLQRISEVSFGKALVAILTFPVLLFVSILFKAFIIWVFVKLLISRDFPFKASLSILGVITIVSIAAIVLKFAFFAIAGYPAPLSLASAFDVGKMGPMYLLLSNINPFSIYKIILIGLGVHYLVDARVSRSILAATVILVLSLVPDIVRVILY